MTAAQAKSRRRQRRRRGNLCNPGKQRGGARLHTSILYNERIRSLFGFLMAEDDLLTRVMQACAQVAPAPFFPSEFAASSGAARADIDDAIDRLRLNGYLQIVDWVQGKGQGYAPTPAGIEALKAPAELRRPAAAPPPEEPTIDDRIWQRGETVRQALLEPRTPVVTMTLLFANLAMFAIGAFVGFQRGVSMQEYFFGGIFSGRSQAFGQLMDTLGAVNIVSVIGGNEWWRLVSHLFLHLGLIHLGMNMLGLFTLGPLMEAMWGSRRFLYLYVMSGVVAGATVVFVGRAGAVGASGALCGLIASLGVWVWLNRGNLPEQYARQLRSSVGINAFLIVLVSMQPNVSWEGHLGGAVGGALLSVPLHYQRFGNVGQRLASWLGLALIPLAAIALAFAVHARERPAMISQVHLGPAFERADRAIIRQHNEIIVPLFDPEQPKIERDAAFLKKARAGCAEVAEAIGLLLAELATERAPQGSDKAIEIAHAQTYFQHWNGLFQRLDGLFRDPGKWNPARLRALGVQVHAAFELRKTLESTKVIPRLVKLHEVPKKDAAKPPADDG